MDYNEYYEKYTKSAGGKPPVKPFTADGIEVVEGLWVWTNNLERGQVTLINAKGEMDGIVWFYVRRSLTDRLGVLQDGSRVATRHPSTRETAEPKLTTTVEMDRGYTRYTVTLPSGLIVLIDERAVLGEAVDVWVLNHTVEMGDSPEDGFASYTPRQCRAELWSGSRYEQPSYCEDSAEPGSRYCAQHFEPVEHIESGAVITGKSYPEDPR